MEEKIIIYSKQIDGPCVPLTIRMEWLPDGTIKPCFYWTPDGSLYQVLHIYDRTPIAFLKDRGEGLRIKVRAKIIETTEPGDSFLYSQWETYLYFADDRFCEKNMVDKRYEHESKEYIPVILDVFPDGGYELVSFIAKGIRYEVERTLAIEARGSFYAGGVGIWHKVKARKINDASNTLAGPAKESARIAALYFEINKWFVAVRNKQT